uniref:BCL2 interacting protein 5 n=1 Tax=Ursus maritimus TaxID=29073 RepID=A0A452TZ38_URSMA
MERPRGPKKPLSGRRARSLDRSHGPKKDSESWDCQCLSLPVLTSPSRRVPDGTRCPQSLARSVEARGTTAVALSPEETREFLASDQRPPQDTKKDKAQRRGQQGWLKTFINFFLRTGPEEPKEKGSRKAKGKEGLPKPAETPEALGDTAPRKKSHDKKASRKKHGHKKHVAEETKGAQDQEAEGQETGLPKIAAAPRSEEADLGPAPKGEQTVPGIPSAPPPRARVLLAEEIIIRMIVEFLQRVGDQWEEEQLRAPQPEVVPQNPVPAVRKKSQEKKSSLKRAFSHKKHGSEEPKRAGPADVSSPESRPLRRPNFLPLCGRGHQPSTSSSPGEQAQSYHGNTAAASGSGTFSRVGIGHCKGCHPGSEFSSAQSSFLSSPPQQFQVQEPEVAVENLSPPCRRKSHEKKSSFRKAFSHKKHGSKEPKRAGAAGAASPESKPHRRPSFLPLCVGGHQPSTSSSLDPDDVEFQESLPAEGTPVGPSEAPSQTRSHKPEEGPQADEVFESKEVVIQRLVDLLREVDDQLGEQIRRHPSFKSFLHRLSDSSLRKLAATLQSRKAHSAGPDGHLTQGPYLFAFGSSNKFAGNNSHAVLSLMGLRYGHSYTHFPCQANVATPEAQSPD